jgi:peroxiredoxin
MKKTFRTLFAVASLLTASLAFAEELAIGAKAPAFDLPAAHDGKNVAFKPGDGKVSVVVFTCNACPYAKAFEGRLVELASGYQAKGVKFYAVNPNDDTAYPTETMDLMKQRASEKKFPYPYLKDANSATAKAYGAKVTPHVFVVDGSGNVRYRGYIDDSAKAGDREDAALSNALDALLAKKDVTTASTKAFGCSIKWKKAAA